MKKFKKLAMVFSIALVGLTSAVVLANIGHEGLFFVANEGYQINLDGTNNPVQGLTKTLEQLPNQGNYSGGDYVRYPVKSIDGNQSVTMFAEDAFIYPEGLVGLGFEGSFGNAYLKNQQYHSRINGLKTLTVHYQGTSTLTVNYGYEDDLAKGHYRVTSVPLASGVPYNFDNNFPQYFSVNTEQVGYALIDDISVVYSCNQIDQKLPTQPYHESGFEVGVIHGRETWSDVYYTVAHSDEEAHYALEDAIVRHFQTVRIKFSYDNICPLTDIIAFRRNFSHVGVFTYVGDAVTKDQVVEFLLVYWGDTYINNDVTLGHTTSNSELAFRFHTDVASFHTNVTPKNDMKSIPCANSLIRLNYAKTHNLSRPSTYDNFPIDKLSDDRYIDVYNSEDLWWAAQHDFKPRFVNPNGKPAWIYSEAKKILNSIIYDGMSNFEKIRAIYEWMIDNCQYDGDAPSSARGGIENTCFFLEGVFEARRAVCDGFSKSFVLLAKMEGLDVKRGLGFGPDGGHAWALARTNPSEDYYLVCPTWGDGFKNVGTDQNPDYINVLTYEAFMTSKNYFRDAGGMEFVDLLNRTVKQAEWIYPQSIYMLDKLPGYEGYDYCVDNKNELSTIVKEGVKACGHTDFAINFVYGNQDVLNQIDQAIVEAGISNDKWDYKVWFSNNLYYVTEVTIGLFAK